MSQGISKKPKKICVIGSGNWATAIVRIVGENAKRHDHLHNIVTMYVYEETVQGRNLSDIINQDHVNVKYLPGYSVPKNVVAVPNVVMAAKEADCLIFVFPHQFVRTICANLLGKIKPTACALSLIKGFSENPDDGRLELVSGVIHRLLRINVGVLMGANLASEVAADKFAEGTLGCPNKQHAPLWIDILQSENFKITVTDDMTSVEVYSGLKNVIAIGAGFIDGLELGHNSKATFIRMGMLEMILFVDIFFPGGKMGTFFESCGIGDLITTCFGGRNRRVAETFVKTGESFLRLQSELLHGQQLQGPLAAKCVNKMLRDKDMEHRFPIMTTIHLICTGEMKPEQLVDAMKAHPDTPVVLYNTSF